MKPGTKYKLLVIKETLESIGILIGAVAMASSYAHKAYSDTMYTIKMLKQKDILFDPDLEFEEVNENGE